MTAAGPSAPQLIKSIVRNRRRDNSKKPASPALPEIFTASRSPRGLDMVAKAGDWWFLDFDKGAETVQDVMASLRHSIDVMDRKAATYGRKVRYAFNPFVAFGDSVANAKAGAMRLLVSDGSEADMRKIMQRVAPAMKAGCIGPPELIRDQLRAYRDLGIFYENAVNRILRDIVAAIHPAWCVVRGEFTPRGGLTTTVESRWPRNTNSRKS